MSLQVLAPFIATAVLATTLPAQGSVLRESKLVDLSTESQFGQAVAVSGDFIAVGAPIGGAKSVNGSVFTYDVLPGGIGNEQQLTDGGGSFGNAVAIDGNHMVIGAKVGASAYIYERVGASWVQRQRLRDSVSGRPTVFGHSVGISDKTIVIGAKWSSAVGYLTGAAFVYEQQPDLSWLQAPLNPASRAVGDTFGEAVAIDGDTIAVSATGADSMGFNAGAVTIFRRSGMNWVEEAQLVAPDGHAFADFGRSLDLDGDSLVVGADADNEAGLSAGAAYVFMRSGSSWTLVSKLQASNAAAGDNFGRTVSIDQGRIFVGASGKDGLDSDAGAIYRFQLELGLWVQHSAQIGSGSLGASLSLDNDRLISGQRSDGGVGNGSARVFTVGSGGTPELAVLQAGMRSGRSFGLSLAIAGDTVFVGEPQRPLNDAFRQHFGAVHVLGRRDSSTEIFDRIGPLFTRREFGKEVAVTGNTLVVSGGFIDVYTLERIGDRWEIDAELHDQLRFSWTLTGLTISAANNRIAVGLPDAGSNGAGLVATFTREDFGIWRRTQVIPGQPMGEGFGTSIRMYGDRLLATSRLPLRALLFSFESGQWTFETELPNPGVSSGSEWGRALALTSSTVVIGASMDDGNTNASGSAYVYEDMGGSWTETAKLTAMDGDSLDEFGRSVAVMDDVILVGAPADDDMGVDSGSVYVFRKVAGTWIEDDKILASDGTADARFGDSVAMSLGSWAISAPSEGSGKGAVYRLDDPDYDETFGLGCAANGPIPTLLPRPGHSTSIGNSMTIDVSNLPIDPASATIGLLGFSGAQWEQFRLPLDLRNLAPGCVISSSLDRPLFIPKQGTLGRWIVDLPNDPGLIGFEAFFQAAAAAPQANSLGLIFSNSARVVLTN